MGFINNLKTTIQPYLTKRNILIGSGGLLLLVIAVVSLYLPGMLYKGSVPQGFTQTTQVIPSIPVVNTGIHCSVSPSTAVKGSAVTWSLMDGNNPVVAIQPDGHTNWCGSMGTNGQNACFGGYDKSVTTTYPLNYSANTVDNVKVDFTQQGSTTTYTCPKLTLTAPKSYTCAATPNPAPYNSTVTWTLKESGNTVVPKAGESVIWYGHVGANGQSGSRDSSVGFIPVVYPNSYSSPITDVQAMYGSSGIIDCAPLTLNTQTSTPSTDLACAANEGTSITYKPLGTDVNWTATITSNLSYTPTFSWTGTDALTGTGKTLKRTYSASGEKKAHVAVFDGSVLKMEADCTPITLETLKPKASCSVMPAQVEAGEAVSFKGTVENAGIIPAYSWTEPTLGKLSDQKDFSKSFTTTGDYKAKFNITINGTTTSSTECPFTVVPATKLTASCSADSTTAVEGDDVTFTATATGAKGNVSYSWNGDVTGTSQEVTKSFSTTGDKTATVTVTDSNGSATASCKVSIEKKTQEPLSVSCQGTPTKAETGDKVTWLATVSGVTDPSKVTYSWDGDVTGTKQSVTTNYNEAGKKVAIVTADYNGASDSSYCQVDIALKNAAEPNLTASKCTEKQTYYPTDIDSHWAKDVILNAYDKCYLEGYSDYTFRPDTTISRAEAFKIADVMAAIESVNCTDKKCGTPFTDMDSWQGPWIKPAYDKQIAQGYPGKVVKPNDNLTRAEATALVSKAFGITPFDTKKCYTLNCGAGYPSNFFNDITDLWQGGYIRALWDLGIVQGTAKNKFEPNRAITRAEFLKLADMASKGK